MARGRAMLFLLALASCVRPPGLVQIPPPAPAASAPPSPAPEPPASPCVYGLAAPEISLTPEVAELWGSDVAWAGGRLLVAYGAVEPGTSEIRARLYDPAARNLSPPMRLSPRGYHVEPHVAAIGDRFLVTWQKPHARGDCLGAWDTWARWVSATGELGPEPVEGIGAFEGGVFADVPGTGYVRVTWADGVLRRTLLDADLVFHGNVTDLAQGVSLGDRFAEVYLERTGRTLLALGGSRAKGGRGTLRLLLSDWRRRVVQATEVAGPDGVFDGSPALLTTPDGLLLAWNRRDPAGEHAPGSGVWIQWLDERGAPREAPRQIVEARGSHDVVQLLRAPAGPVLVWGQHASAMALSWEGVPLERPTSMAPLAPRLSGAQWITADGDPWVAFTDIRHARPERFGARVRCGGDVPALPLSRGAEEGAGG